MKKELHRYLATGLLGLMVLAAGCAAKDVEVSHRGPVRGEATIEGDTSSTSRSQSHSQSTSRQDGARASSEATSKSGY